MSEAAPIDPSLLPPRQLFRFSFDLRSRQPLWTAQGADLDESYALLPLAGLDGEQPFGDVRMAWGPVGLAWRANVTGKKQPAWCRESRLDESDGLQVWIDTRGTFNVHRATRFCHRFVYLPAGGGRGNAEPIADQLLIDRARENARPVRPRELAVKSKIAKDGYTLWGFASAEALGGYDPEQAPRLGFTYALFDRELGLQTFSTGPSFPYEDDPSCWAELRLVSE